MFSHVWKSHKNLSNIKKKKILTTKQNFENKENFRTTKNVQNTFGQPILFAKTSGPRFRSMDRFVRHVPPKLAADSTPQPVEVATAAAPQRGARPEAVANSDAEAADEAESNGEASSVEGEYSHITGLLDELAKQQPAAGQWAAQLPSDAEVTSSLDAYLRHRARQLLGYIATLTTKQTQRNDKILKIHDYSRRHSVAQTQFRLRQKAARQLRELHEAAQAHRPDLQALHAAKNSSPHAAQLLLWGFILLDPTRSRRGCGVCSKSF